MKANIFLAYSEKQHWGASHGRSLQKVFTHLSFNALVFRETQTVDFDLRIEITPANPEGPQYFSE